MLKIPFQTAGSPSRRGVLKQGLGIGLSAIVAGCGRSSGGVSGASGGGGGQPAPTPTDPVSPGATPQPPTPPPPTKVPTNPQPVPSGATPISATVTSNALGAVGSDFLGLSFEKGELISRVFSAGDTNMINLFKALGPGIMRIGGSGVDAIRWTPAGAGRTARQIAKVDIDQFIPFIKATRWQVIYGINLAQNTEAAAAEEADYVAKAFAAQGLADRLYCFELGNEPAAYDISGYAVPSGYASWNYDTFKGRWLSLRNAILNKVPTATFAGPDATQGSVAYTSNFARDIGAGQLKVLSQHYYRLGDRDTRTLPALLAADTKLAPLLSTVKSAADGIRTPFRITETNSITGGGVDSVSNVYGSALWALDHMFTVAKGGASGIHFHGGAAANYTPFTFGSSQLTEIRPLFYALSFFKMAGEGAVVDASISAGGKNISAYAIRTGSGMSVMFVNKEVSDSFKVSLQFPGPATSATAIQLTGPGPTSKTGIYIQGAQISMMTGLGAQDAAYSIPVAGQMASVYVPALTAILVTAR